jgi:DNA-binding NarL/FixJ family response regulator
VAANPGTGVLMLTRAGARGYLLKNAELRNRSHAVAYALRKGLI